MNEVKLVVLHTKIEERQHQMLRQLTSNIMPMAAHVRRALDMYFSQPVIQEALKEREQ